MYRYMHNPQPFFILQLPMNKHEFWKRIDTDGVCGFTAKDLGIEGLMDQVARDIRNAKSGRYERIPGPASAGKHDGHDRMHL